MFSEEPVAADPPVEGYRHYNPVTVDVHFENGALLLALTVLTLSLILFRMQARQQQLIDRLVAKEQPQAGR